MIEEIHTPPCDVSWFQAELDRMRARYGHKVRLRIAWCPPLVELLAVNPQGDKLEFKKYPALDGYFEEWIEGYSYLRRMGNGWAQVGYQKNGDPLIPPDVKTTDIAVPDYRRVNPSIHIFVIESLVPADERERDSKEKRRMSLEKLGFDIFQEDTGEVWEWKADISEHRDGCCAMATEREIRCHGLYRAPDQRDLERVRVALQEMEASGVLDHEDNSSLVERRAKNLSEAINRYRGNEYVEVLKELRESVALDEVAQTRSRVVGGVTPPRHRTSY